MAIPWLVRSNPPSTRNRSNIPRPLPLVWAARLPVIFDPSSFPIASDQLSLRERDPVSDTGPILKHRSGPSSQLSGPIADFWRVLKTRKDSDSHPPPLPGGAYRCAPDPISEKKIESRKISLSVSLSLPRSVGAFVGMQSPEIVQQYINARWRKASPPQPSRIPLPRRFACVIILQ